MESIGPRRREPQSLKSREVLQEKEGSVGRKAKAKRRRARRKSAVVWRHRAFELMDLHSTVPIACGSVATCGRERPFHGPFWKGEAALVQTGPQRRRAKLIIGPTILREWRVQINTVMSRC
jgi:hypothetical protein